jgi:hypothetical protein
MTTLLDECGEGQLDVYSTVHEEEGVAICLNQDTEFHGTGSSRRGSTMASTSSGLQDSAQEDVDEHTHGGTTAHISRRPRPLEKEAALAGRRRSRRGRDAGATEDERALTDALSASTQQLSDHLARSEVQRARRNEMKLRRVLLLERELEVRKFELY